MQTVFLLIQIFSAASLIFLILIQAKGTGLGSTFGGGQGTSFTRRGLEKVLFKLTFVIAIIFIAVSILQVVA